METWGILTAGLLIVVVGILRFKLHAFVALILAGTVVALFTPERLVSRSAQREAIVKNSSVELFDSVLEKAEAAGIVIPPSPLKGFESGRYLIVADSPSQVAQSLEPVGMVTEEVPREGQPTGYRFDWNEGVDGETLKPEELFVISKEKFSSSKATAGESCISRLTTALGSYCGKLAILIVAASIIGRCLLESGAADRLVQSAIGKVGERNAPAAFAVSGFTLSIPVFFDTVFFLMVPLAKALRLRTGKNYLLYVLATVAGGTMAHSLVPPTPGPLFIAEAFNVPLASMILGGCFVGLISSSVGMLYAYWINSRCVLELPDDGIQHPSSEPATSQALDSESSRHVNAPSVAFALMPVILPVLLITSGAFVSETDAGFRFLGFAVSETIAETISTLAEKNTALMLSAAVAIVMYLKAVRPTGRQFQTVMQEAVSGAGTIILVTAAGGAFGRMMRQANVAELLEGLPGSSPVVLVIAAFVVTTAVRTAQGSSTVAMLTSAGIFGGLVTSGAAGVDPLYVALAVGCGSKPFAWMNDSGFWVITRMSGMSEAEGLRYVTPMTALAAFAGLGVVILGVVFFP